MKKLMTQEELKKINKRLSKLELDILHNEGLAKLSGGYCNAEIESITDDLIEILVTYGLDEDGHSEKWLQRVWLNRKDLSINRFEVN